MTLSASKNLGMISDEKYKEAAAKELQKNGATTIPRKSAAWATSGC